MRFVIRQDQTDIFKQVLNAGPPTFLREELLEEAQLAVLFKSFYDVALMRRRRG